MNVEDGSYRMPRLEHARVADAMRHGILSCSADASLRDAARTMSTHHVHTIVVTDPSDASPVGMLSDRALLAALLDGGAERPLKEIADSELDTISSDESLAAAAATLRERGMSHLIVRDSVSGKPSGMLSTLDIAGVLAWGEA